MLPPPPRGFSNPRDREEVRQHFSEVGFDARAVVELTHRYTRDVMDPRTRAAMLHTTNSPQPRAVLLRLFTIGEAVPQKVVEGALGPVSLTEWERAGYLESTEDGSVRALVSIWPFAGMWVAADREPRESGDPSVVAGLTGSTETLARICIRGERVDRACDLGTGNGLLAMILARDAEQVIATDLEPRAIAFAEQNAIFNEVENIEFRVGDGLEPLANEKFDRVLFNPPFVLSPEPHFTYRDGGTDFLPKILAGLPSHLAPGGFAQLLGQWSIRADGSPGEIFRAFEGSNADVEVLLGRVIPVAAYTTQWCVGSDASTEIPRWLEAFREQGIERIAEGLITIGTPRVEGEPSRTLEPAPPRLDEKSPREIAHRFRRNDYLRGHVGAALGGTIFQVALGVRIVQETESREDGWAAPRLRLIKTTGLVRDREIDGDALGLVTSFDGTRTLDAVIAERVETSGERGDESADRELARELCREGFLEIRLDR